MFRVLPCVPPVVQRIAAADLASGLRYFGRHIHGRMDMNEDGLVDLAVGSFGAAVLLWSVVRLLVLEWDRKMVMI